MTDRSSVEKNAANSILLQAPNEVRDSILKFVLGNEMIHIKFLSGSALEELLLSESKDPKTIPEDGGLCAAFCVAEKSEQAAYNEANLNAKDVQASEDPNIVETCKERHETCLMCGKHDKANLVTGLQGERLTFDKNLSVLAVCRQLYEESNIILWKSNIFSFDDPNSFTEFVGSMNRAQKSKLSKIHLSLNIPIDESSAWRIERWAKAIPGRILTPLKAVKTVHLTIDQYSSWDPEFSPTDSVTHSTSQAWVTQSMNRMLGLRMFPWKHEQDANQEKHVTVIITDDTSTHLEAITPRWSKTSKLEVAENLRALLADPNSVEIHKAYTAAEKIAAAKRKAQEEKEGRIEKLQDAIDDLESRVSDAKADWKWRKQDLAEKEAGYKNPMKPRSYLSNYQRRCYITSAKERLDALDERLRSKKADRAKVRKELKDLTGEKTSEDSGDDQDKSGDNQNNSDDDEYEHLTPDDLSAWLKGPIPYGTK